MSIFRCASCGCGNIKKDSYSVDKIDDTRVTIRSVQFKCGAVHKTKIESMGFNSYWEPCKAGETQVTQTQKS